MIDLPHLCGGLAKLCAVIHEGAAASYHPAFRTQQLGELLFVLIKVPFTGGGNWFNQTWRELKKVSCIDQSTLALSSEQWWLSHKSSLPALSRWRHCCICDSLLTQISLQRAWHTQNPPTSPWCCSELDLWQELPKVVLTSLCSAKCLWKPHSKLQGLRRSIYSQVKLCSCSRLL